MNNQTNHLARRLGILSLTATGICSMLGASINVVPFMIHRSVPGIGPYVLYAFLFAAIPALLAALAYGCLSSAMPRAGGSYIYASRGLNPYLGFIASFSQWFGLSIVIGVIAYVIVPFLRDICIELEWENLAISLEIGWVRISLSLLLIWSFIYINIKGGKYYERTVIPLMFIMFILGGIVIVAGFLFDQNDFTKELLASEQRTFTIKNDVLFEWNHFLSAAALLFSSFIGFDAIAQAGGEAKNPARSLPMAIGLAILIVGGFYFLFTASVYHTVPWSFVAEESLMKDISAPGLMSYVLPSGLAIAILVGAAIALINDLPAMLLSVSRLMFAWAEDGIFPKQIAKIHDKNQTPYNALYLSGVMASIGVLGSHFAGDFFLGIDIMVTSMMVNFLLICVTLITIPSVNSKLSEQISMFKSIAIRRAIGYLGTFFLIGFLTIHVWKDINAEVDAWYFHSTPIWIIVMLLGSIIFLAKIRYLKKEGTNIKELFSKLPSE